MLRRVDALRWGSLILSFGVPLYVAFTFRWHLKNHNELFLPLLILLALLVVLSTRWGER